ncbi:MAG: RNase P subunit p30 family protein [Promethearchaeota archaeon]
MRAYDLHIQEESRDIKALRKLCTIARDLGFSGIAVETRNTLPIQSLDTQLSIFRRYTLSPRSAARLRIIVEKRRKHFDLFAVHGKTKPISLAAAIVPNVDLVMLRELSDFAAFDSQVARTLAKENKPVEVCLRGLIILSGADRSRLMRVMASAMANLIRAKCTLILTSGATKRYGIRSPRDLAALSYLANIPEHIASAGVYENTNNLVEQLTRTQDSKQEVTGR